MHGQKYPLNVLLVLFLTVVIVSLDLSYKLSAGYAKWWPVLDWLYLRLLNICWSGMIQIYLKSWLVIIGFI